MLRLIEEIDSSTLVTIGGRSYPIACVVENTDDGYRWLIWNDTQSVQPSAWLRAHGAGVMGIVVPQGEVFWVVSTERFMEYRTESLGMYLIDDMRLEHTFPGSAIGGTLAPPSAMVVPSSSGFVHLHTHTDYSDWDGLQTVQEAIDAAVSDNQPALAVSDHGNCAAHPDLARLAKKAGIKPIFAIETYLVPDRFGREADVKYNHLILIAKTQLGLQNVWAASTEAYRDGLYDGHARLDWDTLDRHSEGVICSTGCLSGPISKAILEEDEERARALLARLQHIYKDDLYVEIHTNSLPEQKKVNETLVTMARDFSIPMIGVVDSHFSTKEQGIDHKMWMACATRTTVVDDAEIFGFNGESWLLSEAEARDALSYLGPDVVDECITNTVVVADSCTATIGGKSTAPVFSKTSVERPDPVQADVDRLIDLCMSAWQKKTTGKQFDQDTYMARFEREMGLLIAKGFCGYFLMVADYCLAAKEGRIDGLASGKLTGNPILVGPGRGSGGGSLVAYLSGITGVDPVDADLLFERFLTEGRESLPDFDVDFPASKKQDLLAYVRQTWGEEYVATVGSHLRLKSKGIINSLSAARSEELPESAFLEFKAISKIITAAEAGTAGLGLTWEELWAQEGDLLEPYRAKYPDFFEQCGRLVNRLKTYGKHAAGVVISTDTPLTGSLPLRKTDDDGVTMMVTQFEKDALESLGLVKFDLLTIRTLDTIQMCVDLIRSQRGTSIVVEEWRDEYLDPQVWAEVKAAHTLGIFQIETGPGTALTRQMKPGSVAELADMITLVRPGPRRSGLTEKYLARRDGREAVSFPDPRMEQVLAKTYGCLLYQEDIMAACMVLAGYDGNEADEVRSILGKKKVEKIPAAGEKFIRESVARGMVHSDAAALWAQMAEFAKYSFNRAHAFAYAVIGYWCAWLKFHYPVQFLTAVLSTLDEKERIPAFITEARRMGYAVLPPDINESRNDFTGSPLAVRYGFSALKGLGNAGNVIAQHQPFTSYDDFIERVILSKDNPVNMGQVKVLTRIGAFDSLVPNRAGLIEKIEKEASGEATRCQFKNEAIPLDIRPFNPKENKEGKVGDLLPCLFAWEDLPVAVGRTGKPLKDQSKRLPARKCSKACSQYVSVPSFDMSTVQPFSAKEIRDIEHEMLGVYLSSTPFDLLDPADREECRINADTLEEGPDGVYFTAGLVVGIDPRKTKSSGEDYANITIETEGGTFRCSAFDLWRTSVRDDIVMGQLAFVEIKKKSPFYNLVTYLGVS